MPILAEFGEGGGGGLRGYYGSSLVAAGVSNLGSENALAKNIASTLIQQPYCVRSLSRSEMLVIEINKVPGSN